MAKPSVTFTQQQQQDLINAIASGAERVSYSDKSVEYRSLTELREILAGIDAELTGVKARRTFRMVSPWDKGL
ncbi:phage head-tail joining protein [Bradyrhizobium sp. vgs-9]|uniref:phage head-tail joining protein n=1 Tax=Bradyrhizobium sp. vgs-9 TaxID=208389 RepID=UPI0035D42C03